MIFNSSPYSLKKAKSMVGKKRKKEKREERKLLITYDEAIQNIYLSMYTLAEYA